MRKGQHWERKWSGSECFILVNILVRLINYFRAGLFILRIAIKTLQ